MSLFKRLIFGISFVNAHQILRLCIRPYYTRLLSFFLALFAFELEEVQAQQQQPSTLLQWWNGPYATGDWFGGRTFLEDHGVLLEGNTTSIYYGVPTNDLRQNSVYCYNLVLDAKFDFGKMLGLQGLSGQIGIQWETGERFQNEIGVGDAFSPIAFVGDWSWRLKPIVLTYVTPELFGIKEFFTLSGGWQNAKDYFLVQPSASFFQNNAFGGGGGLVANEVLFDGNYVAWGGYTKVKPTDWYYIQAGLWAAVPGALDWHNRGIYFALANRRNGLFFMGETGFTPKWGSSRLPGKYAFGGYYWGITCKSFYGDTYPGSYGFYWQVDQMLYREPSPVIPAPNEGNLSKNTNGDKQPLTSIEEKLSPQGLYAFGLITYAPPYNNELPFFLRTGLVYKGLIPARDKDDLGIAFAYGSYSYDKIRVNRTRRHFIPRTSEAVLEVDYRFQINRWLYVQPFLEYIIRHNYKDALVLGIRANLIF